MDENPSIAKVREIVAAAVQRLSHATRLSNASRDLLVFSAFHAAIADPLDQMAYEDVAPHIQELSRVGVTVVGRYRLLATGEGVQRGYAVEPLVG